jgi:transposase
MLGEFIEVPPIPRETARTAKAIFGCRNFYMRVGECLEAMPADGSVARTSAEGLKDTILTVVTFFQALEGLTDVQAMDAVRTRIDWKYALHLGIHSPSIQEDALCELRRRIILSPELQSEFQSVLDWLITLNPPLSDKPQVFRNTEVLAFICSLNRLGRANDAICQTLEALARTHPFWLRKRAMAHWYGRYNGLTLGFDPSAPRHDQESALQEIGADIRHLLDEVGQSALPELCEVQEVRGLQQIWEKEFEKRNERVNSNCIVNRLIDCEFCIHRGRTKEVHHTKRQ